MKLLPIDSPQTIDLVARWLGERRNYQWLDSGNGVRKLDRTSLTIMVQKDIHVLRVYTADDDVTPIGVVGLSNVDHHFKTAMVWIVLGEKKMSNKGYPLRAGSKMLALGFQELGLRVISAWAVEINRASVRIIKRLNFQRIGTQRKCHYIDGRAYDRLLFDIMAEELREIHDA